MPDENVTIETAEGATETSTETKATETAEGTEVSEESQKSKTEEKAEDGGESLDLTESQYELIRDLLDPKTQRAAVERLAREQGIYEPRAERRAGDTERTAPTSKKAVIEEIKEIMGDEFDQIPAKAWRAIEKLFDAKLEPLREQFQEAEANRLAADSKAATTALYKQYKDAEKYSRDMVALMEQYIPAKGQTQFDFLEDMYHLAKSRRTSSSSNTAGKFVARVRSNAKEERIAEQGSDDRNIAPGSSKKISLDEAAKLAMAGKKISR